MALLKSRIGLGPPLNLLPREKNSCISSLHPYEIFQVAFSPVLSTQPCLCLLLSVALLAKSAFPGSAAWLGSAVPQPAVLAEGDLTVRPYGEAAGLGDRGDVFWLVPLAWLHFHLHEGWCGLVLGCCAHHVLLYHPQGRGLGVEPHQVLAVV